MRSLAQSSQDAHQYTGTRILFVHYQLTGQFFFDAVKNSLITVAQRPCEVRRPPEQPREAPGLLCLSVFAPRAVVDGLPVANIREAAPVFEDERRAVVFASRDRIELFGDVFRLLVGNCGFTPGGESKLACATAQKHTLSCCRERIVLDYGRIANGEDVGIWLTCALQQDVAVRVGDQATQGSVSILTRSGSMQHTCLSSDASRPP